MGITINATVNGQFTSINGWMQFMLGLRQSGTTAASPLTPCVGFETTGGLTNWWQPAESSNVWLRIEHWTYDTTTSGPQLSPTYRVYYKYRAQDSWIRFNQQITNSSLRTIASDANFAPGFQPQNIRLALIAK